MKTECEYLLDRSEGLDYEGFVSSEELKRSFIRSLEIIGEAAKHVPVGLRKRYSQIRWKSVVDMRNILIHEYFGVDYMVIWKVIKEKILILYNVICMILRELEE